MTLDVSAVGCESGREALQLAVLAKEAEEISSLSRGEPNPTIRRTALEVAACAGHIDAMERLLEAGADPNAPVTYSGRSALEAAAAQGQLVAVQKLLEKGAHPDHCSPSSKSTALLAATKAGHIEISKALVRAGADVTIAKRWSGGSPIVVAARTSSITLLELFLGAVTDVKSGFDPDDLEVAVAQGRQKDARRLVDTAEFLEHSRKSIDAALVVAGQTGDMFVIQRLLDAGADVNAHTAIAAAAEGGHLEAMNKLLRTASDQNNLPTGTTTLALQSAVDAGNTAMIEPLLQAGADATEIDIAEAAAEGYLDVLTSILQSGASAETMPSFVLRGTALQLAAKRGHEAVVDLLLARGADVNAPPYYYHGHTHGGTAVQFAIAGGHMAVTKRLIDAGADVNAPSSSKYSDTALQAATRTGNTAMLELLLAAGAVVDTADMGDGVWNKTALSVAAEANKPEFVERILSMMRPDDARRAAPKALKNAVENHSTCIVRQLLQVHPNVNLHMHHPLEPRTTLLQMAAANGDLAILEMLLTENADVNLNPTGGWRNTALQSASERGSLDAVKLLLAAAAEVNVTGSTAPPLLLAVRYGHMQVVEHLLAAGADIHATAYQGQTMLQAAEDSGNADMQELVRAALALNPRPQPQDEQPQDEQPLGRGTGPLCEACRTAFLADVFHPRGNFHKVESPLRGESLDDPWKPKWFTLHPSLIALRASAGAGCPFCCFVWKRLRITSVSLPQPSPVRFYLQSDEPGTMVMTCQVDEPFPRGVQSPEQLMAHFDFAIEPFRGEISLSVVLPNLKQWTHTGC